MADLRCYYVAWLLLVHPAGPLRSPCPWRGRIASLQVVWGMWAKPICVHWRLRWESPRGITEKPWTLSGARAVVPFRRNIALRPFSSLPTPPDGPSVEAAMPSLSTPLSVLHPISLSISRAISHSVSHSISHPIVQAISLSISHRTPAGYWPDAGHPGHGHRRDITQAFFSALRSGTSVEGEPTRAVLRWQSL